MIGRFVINVGGWIGTGLFFLSFCVGIYRFATGEFLNAIQGLLIDFAMIMGVFMVLTIIATMLDNIVGWLWNLEERTR